MFKNIEKNTEEQIKMENFNRDMESTEIINEFLEIKKYDICN